MIDETGVLKVFPAGVYGLLKAGNAKEYFEGDVL